MNTSAESIKPVPTVQARVTDYFSTFPWWALLVLLGASLLVYNFITNQTYQDVLNNIGVGVKLTIMVTMLAYMVAIVLGLTTALGQLSSNLVSRNLALLYVQVVRGVPILVQIFIVSFVFVPMAIDVINGLGSWLVQISLLPAENPLLTLSVRKVDFVTRGIFALATAYGAFESEIFRAGIQSIERGQLEAAKAIGLNRFQSLRLIILPQAIRRVLPPLGNDFISMLKDSSLVSVIGVGEITQLSKKYAAASFRFPETYYTLAFLYLTMTLLLALGVRFMERRLRSE